jgi:hypothetical protein
MSARVWVLEKAGFLLMSVALLASGQQGGVTTPDFKLTEASLQKTMAALQQMQRQNLPFNLEGKTVEESIASLNKQAKARGIIKKQGMSLREFVLSYKAASQIRKAQKAQEEWQRTLLDPDASAAEKLQATQNLGQDWQKTLGTPDQIELVSRHLPELDKLLPPPHLDELRKYVLPGSDLQGGAPSVDKSGCQP